MMNVMMRALVVLIVSSISAFAQPAVQRSSMEIGVPANPPIGWFGFCVRYFPECATKQMEPLDVELSPYAWAQMAAVNHKVNTQIRPITDFEHWGVLEQWDYPDDGKGDCEDYALEKRRHLMRLGFPRSALLITVALTKGGFHAVLTVTTNIGDYILDIDTDEVKEWSRVPYIFIKRQSQEDPNVWVSIVSHQEAEIAAK